MPYSVVYSSEADADLARIVGKHPIVASHILDEIDKLAEDPVSLSLPPSFPHPLMPKYQFWDTTDSGRCQITVLFQYATSETQIIVRAIGILELSD